MHGFPAEAVRLCRIEVEGLDLRHYTLRLVAINSSYFYLAVPHSPNVVPVGSVLDELSRICELYLLMACIDPDKRAVVAKTTGITTAHVIYPHMDEHREAYAAHFQRTAHRHGR
ncbi:MAG: hypothetical protein HY000_21915 [Planctomycetes bacterium]|nr:hypothetical protein [Planctomycetota bacterium]